MPEGKNHEIERSHSKKWSKTSICEIGNYFWDNPIALKLICFYFKERMSFLKVQISLKRIICAFHEDENKSFQKTHLSEKTWLE